MGLLALLGVSLVILFLFQRPHVGGVWGVRKQEL